jgi:nucleotide-binding universal stress UspA family protein
MATHGRSGPSRWVRGSVAERVLRGSSSTVLLANPRALDQAEQDLRFGSVLVPLDGSSQSESILPTVIELAKLYGAGVKLLRVGWLAPAAMDYPVHAAIPPVTPEELEATLEAPRARLQAAGLKVETAVSFGFEADEILAAIEREPGTLLAMTTHGRTGLDRWLFGSVAEKVLRACTCPVLVKRVAAFAGEGERSDAQVAAPVASRG